MNIHFKTHPDSFWSISVPEQLRQLSSSEQGLSSSQAKERLKKYGHNRLNNHKPPGNLRLFLSQFKSSIILILLFATGLSFYLHERTDAAIIMTIVLISGCLGFWQEKSAADAIQSLLAMVQVRVNVLRDGSTADLAVEEIVPGDLLLLKAGDVIPGDCRILDADNLFVDEAVLTGESFPVEKAPGVLPANIALSKRTNALWMGSHVQSGTATALVVATGNQTEFGRLSGRIAQKAPETEFEHGIRQFGYMLIEITLILVILIFAINVYLHKPVMDSFLFALALAVGLTPQLLPAVISVNLSYGAQRMAEHKVIVKQLAAIENFGSMNVLCSDKTGTLTEGVVHLRGCLDMDGNPNPKTGLYAYLNSALETGFNNPIDEAIRQASRFDIHDYEKIAEIPYDFYRKRLSILVGHKEENILITKGAFASILGICSLVEIEDGALADIHPYRTQIQQLYEEFSRQGLRTLGLAYKPMAATSGLNKEDEKNLRFLGFLTLLDPPKADSAETLEKLRSLGVGLKIITGDNRLVATTISKQMGLPETDLLTGPEIAQMSDNALANKVCDIEIFAEVEPNQKERIILALKKAGFVVGYMGDGINDVPALHAADVGISVNSAADAAKETAQIVLMEQDLGVLIHGVCEGRRTFANTLKYVFMATSANFGNMFSMAGASILLPFLPLLPKQILMTNLLTDLPEMTIASDKVDSDMIAKPRRWNIAFIRKFMMTFGFVSSVFDFATFGLLWFSPVSEAQFRTGWFLESVISAALIVFVVRSSKPLFSSKPSRYLVLTTLLVAVFTAALPYTPLAPLAGFETLPPDLMLKLAGIVLCYILTAEVAKRVFYSFVKI